MQFASAEFDPESLRAFVTLVGSSVMLGAAFVALGYLLSASVRDRGTAGALAVGVWLVFIILYDMALLGILAADHGRTLTAGRLNWLLLLNPADTYRLLNLTGFANVSMFAGTAGLGAQISLTPLTLLTGLSCWIAVPLGLATALFARRQL